MRTKTQSAIELNVSYSTINRHCIKNIELLLDNGYIEGLDHINDKCLEILRKSINAKKKRKVNSIDNDISKSEFAKELEVHPNTLTNYIKRLNKNGELTKMGLPKNAKKLSLNIRKYILEKLDFKIGSM